MDSLRKFSANAGSRLLRLSLGGLAVCVAAYVAASLVLFIIPIAAAGWLLSLALQGQPPAPTPSHGGWSLKA